MAPIHRRKGLAAKKNSMQKLYFCHFINPGEGTEPPAGRFRLTTIRCKILLLLHKCLIQFNGSFGKRDFVVENKNW